MASPHMRAAFSMAATGRPGDLAGPFRRAVLHGFQGLLEAVGVLVDEVPVDELPLVQQVQDAVGEGRVRAGLQGQDQVRGAGQGRDARIDHDELGAAVAGPPDVVGGDGGALGHVGAGHPDDIRQFDVRPGIGGAVHAEGLLVAGAGAHHAEAAVVVEVLGLQAQAGELADQVALLVGEGHTGQHGEGVLAMSLSGCAGSRPRCGPWPRPSAWARSHAPCASWPW